MERQSDELRKENDRLRKRAAAEREYKEQLLYVSQLEERNSIAQEIHDSLGHAITASVMQLEAAKLLMDKDRAKALDIIQNVVTALRKGMDDIRFTLRNIKPPREQLGLNKLRLLLEEYKSKAGFEIYLTHKGDVNIINVFQWKVIYDNAMEALTNAQKYSGATSMNVSIEVLNKIVKIEYKDNGIGRVKIEKGLGLKGMEERTASLGGKLIVDGSRGFSIIVLLPVENG
jgi:Signal transduction histidine kinase